MNIKSLSELADYEFDDRYVADINGNVYIYNKHINNYKNYKRMNPFITRDGYAEFVLMDKNGKKKHIQGQRIVAGLFIPLIKGKNFVNHKDGNRSNNKVTNLEWVDRSENLLHSYHKLGRIPWNKKIL